MPARGKGWLRNAIEDFIETYGWGDKISSFASQKAENVEGQIFERYHELFAILNDVPGVPEVLKTPDKRSSKGSFQAGLLGMGGMAAGIGSQAAGGFMQPIVKLINYAVDSAVHSSRPGVPELLSLLRRHPEETADAMDIFSQLGWTPEAVNGLLDISKPRVMGADLIRQWYRFPDRRSSIVSELTAEGWDVSETENLKNAVKTYPSLQDLIRLAVREAWSDEVAERFGYDAEFPAIVEQEAEKAAIDPEWVKRFWRAHWELPGIGQAYEMLHRLRPGVSDTPFTADDMRTLFRTADIPEFFRDRLMAISYAPYTRVDVRRLYKEHIIPRDAVKANYLDLGYDEEHAENLTKFTVLDVNIEERALTKENIIAGYKRSIIERGEATEQIVSLGYNSDDAEYFLSIADYDLSVEKSNDEIERAHFLYVEGQITQSDVYGILGPLNLPSKQTADLLVKWDVEVKKKSKLPSQSDLEDFYRRNIITVDDVRTGLRRLRYSVADTELFLLRLDQAVAEEKQADIERAQKEQQRLVDAGKSTVYQQKKADLDVRIAEFQLQIADIKLAIHSITDAGEKASATEAIDQTKVSIAELQVAKAEIRVEAEA
jgi:hypothetical protein